MVALAFLLGVALTLLAGQAGLLPTLKRWAAAPGLGVAAMRARAALPTLRIDLDFAGYQQLVTGQNPQQPLADTWDDDQNCVRGSVSVESTSLPIFLCAAVPLADGQRSASDIEARLPLTLIAGDDVRVLGMHEAALTPVGADAALAEGYLATLQAHGIPVVERRLVHLVINGSRWGVYGMEEAPSGSVTEGEGAEFGSVVVSFDGEPSTARSSLTPALSFAHADVQIAASPAEGGTVVTATARGVGERLTTDAEVSNVLAHVARGEASPSTVLDPEMWGQYMAVTALWRGVLLPDWQELTLIYDSETQRFTPLGTGGAMDSRTPLPIGFVDDPEVQRSYVQALTPYGDPAYLEALPDFEALVALYAALGPAASDPPSLQAALAAHQTQIQAFVGPPLLTARAVERDQVLRLLLSASKPFPVEILGIAWGDVGLLPPDAVIVHPDEGALVDAGEELVLRGRLGLAPVELVIDVPLSAVPSHLKGTPGEIQIVARPWGTRTSLSMPVEDVEAAPESTTP